jgi:hypothetical protein
MIAWRHRAIFPVMSDQGSKSGQPPSNNSEERDPAEIARRMERGIRRFLNTPPEPHGKNPKAPPPLKPKGRPASKGRVHKGRARN